MKDGQMGGAQFPPGWRDTMGHICSGSGGWPEWIGTGGRYHRIHRKDFNHLPDQRYVPHEVHSFQYFRESILRREGYEDKI